MTAQRHVLWWGRFDPAYSRNGVLRQHLAALGWRVSDYHPYVSAWGDYEAALHQFPRVDAVWVPCFRQRDMVAARRWCDKHGVPLVFDPLISAYDKQVWERFKLAAETPAAGRLLEWERGLFAMADVVLADTVCHARFFEETLGVERRRIHVVYVGADETVFCPAPVPCLPHRPLEVLFYGSFVPLHGAETIVEAARVYKGPPVRWRLLGNGPTCARCRELAVLVPNVFFEEPVPYGLLPERIRRADVLLGVFGTTQKAGRVIPNKVFQSLAAGRPVVTRESEAYPETARGSAALRFVSAGDALALAAAVAEWAVKEERLAARSREAYAVYEAAFSGVHVRNQLAEALRAVMHPA